MNSVAVVGMAFGDEGKGATTDYFVRRLKSDLVVRFNGGPQAAHNVVTTSHEHHTFAHFGSGSLAGARTYLSEFVLVEPFSLEREAQVLRGKGGNTRIVINPHCVIITPFHKITNQLAEMSRNNPHGSVGIGFGCAVEGFLNGYSITVGEILSYDTTYLEAKLNIIKEFLVSKNKLFSWVYDKVSITDLVDSYKKILSNDWVIASSNPGINGPVVFEGAQGVLLDQKWGFGPHNTWSNCTFENAITLANRFNLPLTKIGVFRSYFTRHGYGPFPTESGALTPILNQYEKHNKTERFMGSFRYGFFDAVLANYAIKASPPDSLVVTHMDVFCNHRKELSRFVTSHVNTNSMVESANVENPYGGLPIDASVLKSVVGVLEDATNLTHGVFHHVNIPIGWCSHGPTDESFFQIIDNGPLGVI